MQLKQFNVYFFFVLLLGISVLAFFVFKPFLVAVLIAGVLAVILYRPYAFFLRIMGGRERLSAIATSLLGVLIFIALISVILGLIANEATNFYQASISGQAYGQRVAAYVHVIENNKVLQSLGVSNFLDAQVLAKAASQIGQGVLSLVQGAYKGVAHFIFTAFVIFFTLYYLLVGGKKMVKRIMYLSPLKDEHEAILTRKFISISRATVKGTMVVGMVQGTLGGILFAIVGIPSAAVWGIVMAFLSLIPMVGSSIIWFPAGIILLLIGNIWQGVTVLAVGLGFISIIDNFLRPKLVGRDTQMHPLIVFFATLGGISMFGIAGFIIGPVIAALFLSLWDIYAVEFKQQLREFNE